MKRTNAVLCVKRSDLMRGFRGSRSAQNAFNSRFGRDDKSSTQESAAHESDVHESRKSRPVLPDWLKTQETKTREKAEAQAHEKEKIKLQQNTKVAQLKPKKTAAATKSGAKSTKRKVA